MTDAIDKIKTTGEILRYGTRRNPSSSCVYKYAIKVSLF